jgi:signal transduction histidine kinase
MKRTASRAAILGLAAYLAVYVSWQLLHWLPGRQQLGQAFLIPPLVAAAVAALMAARRCPGSPALRSFWLVVSAAMGASAIAESLLFRNDLRYATPPFPTIADAFSLSFYALLFIALLRVPVARVTPAKRLRTTLDGATVVLGAGAVVWYFVLGPDATAGGQSTLAKAVSVAYPVGDLILLAGLAAVLLRRSSPLLRVPLLLIAAGVLASIVADIVYGYGVLHNTYTEGDPIDTLYVLGSLLYALAAVCQQPITSSGQLDVPDEWSEPSSRASWLPYISAPIGFCVLIGVEWRRPFFPDLSLVLLLAAIGGLVAARQYLALRELAAAQSARRDSERVKDEFVSVVGHELRTPLTSIRGSLGLLEGGVFGELPKEAASMVELAVTNTDRLVRLINDILDVERMEAGRMEFQLAPVKASELVGNAMQIVQINATEARMTLTSDIEEDLTVWADSDRIVQVLVNLLGNALKFSPRWSTVIVKVSEAGGEASEASGEAGGGIGEASGEAGGGVGEASGEAGGGVGEARGEAGGGVGEALFSVIDRGRGIPAEELGTIFERFRQVDSSDAREKGGSGLGLAISRDIIEHHGGHMSVQSDVGEGSTFSFTLPLSLPSPREEMSAARSPVQHRQVSAS